MPKSLGPLFLLVLVIGAVSIGLWQVGTPGSAREARLDQETLGDFRTIIGHLNCTSEKANRLTLENVDGCRLSSKARRDPRDDTPYSLIAAGDHDYTLCAAFSDQNRFEDFLDGLGFATHISVRAETPQCLRVAAITPDN